MFNIATKLCLSTGKCMTLITRNNQEQESQMFVNWLSDGEMYDIARKQTIQLNKHFACQLSSITSSPLTKRE